MHNYLVLDSTAILPWQIVIKAYTQFLTFYHLTLVTNIRPAPVYTYLQKKKKKKTNEPFGQPNLKRERDQWLFFPLIALMSTHNYLYTNNSHWTKVL